MGFEAPRPLSDWREGGCRGVLKHPAPSPTGGGGCRGVLKHPAPSPTGWRGGGCRGVLKHPAPSPTRGRGGMPRGFEHPAPLRLEGGGDAEGF